MTIRHNSSWAEIPKVSPIVLTNSDGHPWKTGFGSSWNKALIAAKLNDADLHFHDFRGTAATRMYLAGLTNREIAEATARDEESVDRIIRRYVTRDALLRDRIRKLDQIEVLGGEKRTHACHIWRGL